MKLEHLRKTPYLRALLYGDSGSGKTRLIGSAMECEETFPLLVLNAGGQPVTLRTFDPQPLVLTIEAMADFNDIYCWIRDGQPIDLEREGELWTVLYTYLEHLGVERFGSMAMDSITYVQRMSMDGIVGRMQLLPGDPSPATQIKHWGQTLAQITRLADLHFQLPIHMFITALARHNEVPTLGITMYHPFLWGQSALEVPSHAEMVGRLIPIASLPTQRLALIEKIFVDEFKGEKERPFNVLLTRGGRNFVAKWQGVMNPPDLIIAPTMQKLIDVVQSDGVSKHGVDTPE